MPGTATGAGGVATTVAGYATTAVAAGQYLGETVVVFPCRLTAVKVHGATAGTGAGTTVVDLLKNGVSVWATAANRPTLAATATGEFASTRPNRGTTCNPGDRLSWQVAAISSTGHARLAASAALEAP